jgi:hypothetical protein
MATRLVFQPYVDFEAASQQLFNDATVLLALQETRYLQARIPVPKAGNIHLAWEYAQEPAHHHHFVSMLCVAPETFHVILSLIEDHPVFFNSSNVPQTPVETQLAVTLYRLGHYGNGASLESIAQLAGCSVGSVEAFTVRCFTAIEALQPVFVRKLTAQEKEVEKVWID